MQNNDLLETIIDQIVPIVNGGDSAKFRRTNKAFSEDYLQKYSRANCDLKRYLYQLNFVDREYERVKRPLKVLEIGTQFGITSLAIKKKYPSFSVTTLDKLDYIESSLNGLVAHWGAQGLEFIDCDLYDSFPLRGTYDLILFCSVIEHLPNSPQKVLASIHSALSEDGALYIDMPNLGSFWNRCKMVINGDGPFWPVDLFFESETPFTGHHREYNPKELGYMLDRSSFVSKEIFLFTISRISGLRSLINHFFQKINPNLREYLYVIARKKKE